MKDATDMISAKDRPNLSSFDWQDPFNFSDQLTEEERMLQNLCAALRKMNCSLEF